MLLLQRLVKVGMGCQENRGSAVGTWAPLFWPGKAPPAESEPSLGLHFHACLCLTFSGEVLLPRTSFQCYLGFHVFYPQCLSPHKFIFGWVLVSSSLFSKRFYFTWMCGCVHTCIWEPVESRRGGVLWCRVMGCVKPTDEGVRNWLEEQQVLWTVGSSP